MRASPFPNSVIVRDFNIFSNSIYPTKANAKLIVDSYAVLPETISLERLQWDIVDTVVRLSNEGLC